MEDASVLEREKAAMDLERDFLLKEHFPSECKQIFAQLDLCKSLLSRSNSSSSSPASSSSSQKKRMAAMLGISKQEDEEQDESEISNIHNIQIDDNGFQAKGFISVCSSNIASFNIAIKTTRLHKGVAIATSLVDNYPLPQLSLALQSVFLAHQLMLTLVSTSFSSIQSLSHSISHLQNILQYVRKAHKELSGPSAVNAFPSSILSNSVLSPALPSDCQMELTIANGSILLNIFGLSPVGSLASLPISSSSSSLSSLTAQQPINPLLLSSPSEMVDLRPHIGIPRVGTPVAGLIVSEHLEVVCNIPTIHTACGTLSKSLHMLSCLCDKLSIFQSCYR